MLGDRMDAHGVRLWLVNTGWTGGGYGVGTRMKLQHTRAMISAALGGALDDVPMEEHPVFGLNVPTSCDGVPDNLWDVRGTWDDQGAYDLAAQNLAQRFEANFAQFEAAASDDMKAGAPRVEVTSGQ